jgi:hypothetical protein
MTRRQAASILYATLDRALAPAGFVLRRSDELWVRRIPAGSQSVSVAIYDYAPEFEFEPTFGIRLDAVEEIRHRFSGVAPDQQDLSSTTLTSSSFVLGIDTFAASSDSGVESTAERIAGLILDRGLNFFDRYQDLTAIDRALNVDRIADFDSINPGAQARTAVIVARLAGNPEFEQLVAEKAALGLRYASPTASSYADLVAYLRDL